MMIRRFLIFVLCLNYITCNQKVEHFKSYLLENYEKVRNWKAPTENDFFKEFKTDECVDEPQTYDFVIVGAGSAGSVLANRLSENRKFKVLLLEAGGDDETEFSQIPGVFIQNINSSINWGYISTRQKNFCLGTGGICPLDRGLGLGGSSIINGMMIVRGNRYDFQKWVELGNTGWSFEDILPYYKKSEHYHGQTNKAYRGTKGPINIETPKAVKTLHKALFKAHEEMGYQDNDYNGAGQIGIGKGQSNMLNGKRHSMNQAYLKPIIKRKNLKILTRSLVTKINFVEDRVGSVKILHNDTCKNIKINKELIVSAGSFNSPQLLMLSGIGPQKHLEDLGIKLYKDLPVGQNLQDRPSLLYSLTVSTSAKFYNRNFDSDVASLLKGKGILTIGAGMDIGFYNYNSTSPTDKPVVEIMYSPDNAILTPDEYNTDKAKDMNLLFSALLQYPKSVGELKLKSINPTDYPLIDPKYLEDPEDSKGILLGVRTLQKLVKTIAMREINATIVNQIIDACKDVGNEDSDEYWNCFIKQKGIGIYHPLGTCRMGANTSDSVVDRNLKVHGVENLRVVDASVFPHMISGHLQATVVAVAEKISDEIKKAYK